MGERTTWQLRSLTSLNRLWRIGRLRLGLGVRLGPPGRRELIAAIHRALDLGVNWIDTAAAYGLATPKK